MPQALKTSCIIHFLSWENAPFSLLALWGDKNWPPSIEGERNGKMLEQNGLKWSSLNAPGTENPLTHSGLELDFSLFSLLALWGDKNWPPSIKREQIENCRNKMGLKGCNWSSLNVPGTQTPLSHSVLGLDFSPFSLLALWGNKNWPPSIKVKQIENCQNKVGLEGCKWSSLNAPVP